MKNKTKDSKKRFGTSHEKDYSCSECEVSLSKQLLKAFKNYKRADKKICPFCLKSALKRREGSIQLTGVLA